MNAAAMDISRLYESHVRAGRAVVFDLSVNVLGTHDQDNVTVHLYLDDTSNGKYGLGNTQFVRMNKSEHSDGKGNMCMQNVKWHMMGAVKPCTVHSLGSSCTCSSNTAKPFCMPDTAKVVVTAEVNGKHALVGGSIVPLSVLFANLDSSTGVHHVPIYNSFFAIPPPKGQAATPQTLCDPVKGMPLVTVEFSSTLQQRQSPGTGLSNNGSKVGYALQFARMSHLFKPSQLPTPEQVYVISDMMPGTFLRRA